MIFYIIGALTLLMIIALGIGFQRAIVFINPFTEYTPHFNGTCDPIYGVRGGEDVTIDQSGIAWISATDRHAILAGKAVRGKIMLLDLNQKQLALRDITPSSPPDFRPHGINLWTDKNGARFLFVVNHPSDGTHHILRYRIGADNRLQLTGLYQSPQMISPNDVVAIGAAQFYYTNDLVSAPQSLMQLLELILRLPWGSVGFFDGSRARIIIEGLSFPNGINRSLDGRQIYVAETGGRKLSIYDRDLKTNALTLNREVAIASGLDNIELDERGDLWIAAHPKFLAFGDHVEDKNAHTPSQVFHISLKGDIVEEVYYDHGEALDGAATAAPYGRRLLLGPVFDDHLLLCERR